MEDDIMDKREEQVKIFTEMRKKARETNRLMIEIELCQMQRSLLEKKEDFYLLRMTEFPDILEIAKVGFLKYDYYDRYYTKVILA